MRQLLHVHWCWHISYNTDFYTDPNTQLLDIRTNQSHWIFWHEHHFRRHKNFPPPNIKKHSCIIMIRHGSHSKRDYFHPYRLVPDNINLRLQLLKEACYPNSIFRDLLHLENGEVSMAYDVTDGTLRQVMKISPQKSLFRLASLPKASKIRTRDRPYQAQVVLSTPDPKEKATQKQHGPHVHQRPEDGYRLQHTNMADGVPWFSVLQHCYQGRHWLDIARKLNNY